MFVGSVAVISLVHTARAVMTCELTFNPPNTEVGTCINVYTPPDSGVGDISAGGNIGINVDSTNCGCDFGPSSLSGDWGGELGGFIPGVGSANP